MSEALRALTHEELLGKCAEQEAVIASLAETREPRPNSPYMSNAAYHHHTYLQYKVRSLTDQVGKFKSGEKYVKMREEHKGQIAAKDREIKRLNQELSALERQIVSLRNEWQQVYEDVDKEHAKEISKKDTEIRNLEKALREAQNERDAQKDKTKEALDKMYKAQTDLEDEQGKVLKLKSQINRDHENSSMPSSQVPNRKKITNNREKTGRKPGGQPGHKHHPRKWHTPTSVTEIPAPEEYVSNPDYKPTGKIIAKQLVNIRVELIVNEYFTPQFRHRRTGMRVHAEFPDELVNDVTYGGSVKAAMFLLNDRCNVSIENVSSLLSDLTGGELKVSTGMINGLSKEFSRKTQAEQKKAFADMLLSPVMQVDFTTARVNGKKVSVTVCATPDNVLYFAREHKGHEGIKGTPAETYQNTMVHDHDLTFYGYGGDHQECNDHVLRYLKDSMINEPNLKWNTQMRDLIREMIHFRKNLDPEDKRNPDEIDAEIVEKLELRYDSTLELARQEYEYEPPSEYYNKGFKLYQRLLKYKKEHLLFLHDRRVPHSSSLVERMIRIYKRKQHQVMTFRSFSGLEGLCDSLGVVATLRMQGKNLYESISAMFDMPAAKN